MKRSSIILTLISLCVPLMWADPAPGQQAPQPSKQPAVFKAQLREAAQLGRSTVREIQALPTDDSIPVDGQVHRHAHRVYSLIRAARWGLEIHMGDQSYKDPVLDMAYKRVDQAWNLARTPVDNTRIARAEYISTSVRDLRRAVQLIDQALVLMP